jgi:hypothetical protein
MRLDCNVKDSEIMRQLEVYGYLGAYQAVVDRK